MLPHGAIEKATRAMKKGKGLQVLAYMSMFFESFFSFPFLWSSPVRYMEIYLVCKSVKQCLKIKVTVRV